MVGKEIKKISEKETEKSSKAVRGRRDGKAKRERSREYIRLYLAWLKYASHCTEHCNGCYFNRNGECARNFK